MAFLKKICGKLLQFVLSEKIPEFSADMYINLAKGAKTRFYKMVAKEIVDRIEARRDIRNLLDIGTGPGFLLFEIFDLRKNLELVGIDLSEKLINFAKNEAERRGCSDIKFKISDANCLDFRNNSCDFIIGSGVLHSLKNPAAAIQEWLRVLKPGHDLWIYDPTVLVVEDETNDPSYIKKLFKDMEKSLKNRKDRLLFRLMQWISNLPPKPMDLDYIYTIMRNVGAVESVTVENRGTYLKIAIKK